MKELSAETSQFIEQHANEDVRQLALQAARYPQVDISEAVTQIAGRQTARVKLPTWWAIKRIRYPRHLSMEQCSSEVTARYKAGLITPNLYEGGFTDLSGGFGVDFCCMAANFKQAVYVEQQTELCKLTAHNLPLLGLTHAKVKNSDSIEYLHAIPAQKVIFIDPARRNNQGGKTVAITDCEPDVKALHNLLLEKAERIIVKLSPMLDIAQALTDIPTVKEIHIVAVNNECKELLLVLESGGVSSQAEIYCVNLSANPTASIPEAFCFTADEEAKSECFFTSEVKCYLYEPNVALLKAGAFRTIASRYGLIKLHPNSHLYTSDKLIESFPGRSFEVLSHGGFSKKEIKSLTTNITKANLTVRNFPSSVAELRKRLKLAEGGENYLFATTLSNGNKVWLNCHKL